LVPDARLDSPGSDYRIDVEPQCALDRRSPALSSAARAAHPSGPGFPKFTG
jgi:hypothetical protein